MMDSFYLPLWTNSVPYAVPGEEKEKWDEPRRHVTLVQKPNVEIFRPRPENNKRIGVVICPGGGYQELSIEKEGREVAQWLAGQGITAGVLKYRLPISENLEQQQWVPATDAKQALSIFNSHAKDWQLDPDKIGIMGFSAGGHLAATISTIYSRIPEVSGNPLKKENTPPCFSVLIYPVTTMQDPYTHQGSRANLLRSTSTNEHQTLFSAEEQIGPRLPPTFLLHAQDDPSVHVMNSLVYYQKLHEFNIPAEMHIYPTGGHGFGMARYMKNGMQNWRELLLNWLIQQFSDLNDQSEATG